MYDCSALLGAEDEILASFACFKPDKGYDVLDLAVLLGKLPKCFEIMKYIS